MPVAVNDISSAIAHLECDWELTRPLMIGTRAMRECGKRHLPQWPAEEEESYKARLCTATLFPAYRRTVGVMGGKPFSKPATVTGLSEADMKEWQPWIDDIDRQGVSLHVFAAEMMNEILAQGLAGIYVDVPRVPASAKLASGATTRQAERAAGVRPYFVRVMHNQILGWKVNADGQLVMLRFREEVEVDDGDYGTRCVRRIRVLTPGAFELWEQQGGDGEFVKVDEGTTSLQKIPYVPLYGRRKRYMVGTPPLIDLAYLNVKHWQSQSDQDTILHAARVPILAVIGADDETKLVVGASSAVRLPAQAELKWVEHTGQSIKAGSDSLDALEQQMIQAGAELLVKKPGTRTATESSNDAEGNKCELQRITEDFEDSLDQALMFAGEYVGMTAPRVTLFKDFGAATMGEASAALIKDAHLAGVITGETAIKELQRRGVLSEDIDPAEEAAAAESEVAALKPPTLGAGAELNDNG
ncbi:DUF4055 domain-containing protein [Dyella kyungheensis]|uniref:DUF4055 domain-containing protein n=1 Tax=Dyella kyungheensis TaxID=1242174 RepID=UPI003CF91F7B